MSMFKIKTRLELTKYLGVEVFEHFILIFIAKIIACKPLTLNLFTLLTAWQTENKTDCLCWRMQISEKT